MSAPVRNHRSFINGGLHDQTTLSSSIDTSQAVKQLEDQRNVSKRKSDEQGAVRPSPVAPPEYFRGPEVFDIGELSFKEQKAQAKLAAKLESQAAANRKKEENAAAALRKKEELATKKERKLIEKEAKRAMVANQGYKRAHAKAKSSLRPPFEEVVLQ